MTSPDLDIACRLHDLGAHVTVYDRWPWEMRWRYLSSSPTPTRRWKQPGDADAILVATAWPEFAGISPSTAKAAGVSMTVVDACQDINDNTVREAAGSAISHKQAGRGDPAAALVSLRTAAADPAGGQARVGDGGGDRIHDDLVAGQWLVQITAHGTISRNRWLTTKKGVWIMRPATSLSYGRTQVLLSYRGVRYAASE